MMDIINSLTDMKGWENKVFNDDIVTKWKNEALDTPGRDVSERMFEWSIEELRHKAVLFKERQLVEALDGVFKSDTIVPEDLRESLKQGVRPLEEVPNRKKDWHPGSDGQVLDLVHPSIYPLVYGQSKIMPYHTVGLDDCIANCGNGEVIPKVDEKDVEKYYSGTFQWLPCDIKFVGEGNEVRSALGGSLSTTISYNRLGS